MDWVKFKLPIPIYQQEGDEKCLVFLKRIQGSLQSGNSGSKMWKEDAVFWFLMGIREEFVTKIPFNPSKSMWVEPDELEGQLEKIDRGEALEGPFRINRFQNCFNFFICFNCGNWGHKSVLCKNEKLGTINKAVKRKISDLYTFEHDPTLPDKKKNETPDVDDRIENARLASGNDSQSDRPYSSFSRNGPHSKHKNNFHN